MIQPGGAMALFVLRLAGLLSLEKALVENATSSDNLNHSFILNNTNNVDNSSFLIPKKETLNSYNNSNNSSEFKSPKYSFLKSESVENASEETQRAHHVKNVSNPSIANGKESKGDNVHGKENEGENVNIKESNSESVNKTGDLNVKNVKTIKKLNKHDSKKKQRKPNPFVDSPKDLQGEFLTQKNNTHKNKFNVIEFENISAEIKTETTEQPNTISSTENKTVIQPTIAPRNSNTGFSPVFTLSVNNTPIPFFPNAYLNKIPSQNNETISKLIKFDDSSFKNKNFRGLESPSIDFVTHNFDYYTFDGDGNSSEHELPTLTSRSLVSPVLNGKSLSNKTEAIDEEKHSGKNNVNLESKMNIDDKNATNTARNTDTNVVEAETIKNKKNHKTGIKSRGIGPAPPSKKPTSTSVRNNPYPYGPKVLPDRVLPYDPRLEPKRVPDTFGSLFPDREFLYNYDYNFEDEVQIENETEKDIFFIKNEKPRVLFHFEKPGYSPKLPDSSIPPTRAPTPSDPWDCSPRCPRYTLVDWNPDYDIRQYPVTTWISTVIIADNRILAELEGYMKVQDYFYGLNDRGQLLNMTVPFVTQIKHGRHPGVLEEVEDFTVSLYINHIDDPLNNDIPTPISNEVLIDRLESKTVFAVGFEANVWEVTEAFLNNKTSNLMEKLRQNGEAFLDRYFYLASYSRPELYQPVYYELWIYATAFRDHHISSPTMSPRRHQPTNQITISSINKLCRGVECPPFEVLRTYRYGIQKRRYFDGLFATTSPGGCEFSTISVWKGFMPLHLYKHGVNSHLEVIEATRPIGLIHVKEDSTSNTECPQNMTMAIYLPKRLHSNPPQTGYDAPRVEVSALQDVVVYAYTVGGYLLEPDRVRKELADLKYRLTEFGACFKNDEYYVVVYDFIIRYHGRQNEIWVVAENCKATLNG